MPEIDETAGDARIAGARRQIRNDADHRLHGKCLRRRSAGVPRSRNERLRHQAGAKKRRWWKPWLSLAGSASATADAAAGQSAETGPAPAADGDLGRPQAVEPPSGLHPISKRRRPSISVSTGHWSTKSARRSRPHCSRSRCATEERLARIRQPAADRSFVEREAHSLKGSAGTLGLTFLSALARELESTAHDIDANDCSALVAQIESAFAAGASSAGPCKRR